MQIHALSNLERIHGLDVPRPLIVAFIDACAKLCGWFTEALEQRRASLEARRDRAAFLAMSDHLLRDIGVQRDEIAWSDIKHGPEKRR
jgi:uncharacterized protein YjiS (DUF1127 family)